MLLRGQRYIEFLERRTIAQRPRLLVPRSDLVGAGPVLEEWTAGRVRRVALGDVVLLLPGPYQPVAAEVPAALHRP